MNGRMDEIGNKYWNKFESTVPSIEIYCASKCVYRSSVSGENVNKNMISISKRIIIS